MVNSSGDLSSYFGGKDKTSDPPAIPQAPTQLRGSDKNGNAPEIKVITHQQMASESAAPEKIKRKVIKKLEHNKKKSKPRKKSPISGKLFIAVVILLLIAVDIPIGMRIYQGYQNRNNIAQSDVSQDTGAAAEEFVVSPTSSPPLSPISSPTLEPTNAPAEAAAAVVANISPTTIPTSIPTLTATPTVVVDAVALGGTGDEATGAGDLALSVTQTHSECFEGACIEVEGAGTDQCFVDSDCSESGAGTPIVSPTSAVDDVVAPDTPVAGGIRDTVLGIAAGIGTVLLAVLLLL